MQENLEPIKQEKKGKKSGGQGQPDRQNRKTVASSAQLYQHQMRYFLSTLVAFAVIFLLLGVIVFQFVQSSMYGQVDTNLTRLTENQRLLSKMIERSQTFDGGMFSRIEPPDDENGMTNSFQEQLILWSSDGEILNQNSLGARLYDFGNLELDTSKLDAITNITLTNSNDQSLGFRTIILKSPRNDYDVAYIQVLTNTDQIVRSVDSFKNILIICMLVFAGLSILLSYFLSKRFVQPIILSWRKQQQFVENASHELRTPLTIIQSKLEGLFTKPSRTIMEESEAIALSLNEVERLSRLTNDLLLLARSDSDAVVLRKEPVAINPFLKKTLHPYQEIMEAEGKTFELELSEDRSIKADPARIQQLLVILLDNAMKYTEAGDKITVSSSYHSTDWVIRVTDTGKGITANNKNQIFERFYREDASRNRETGGYGIGLSIAEWIVSAHDGKISVSDNLPKGTVFEIQIPQK